MLPISPPGHSERKFSRRTLLAAGASSACATLAPGRSEARGRPALFGLGTVTYNVCRDWSLDSLLKVIPHAGLEAIEFRTTHAHGVEPSLSPEQREDVRRRWHASGLRQVSLGTVCEFQSPDPEVVRKNVADCLDWIRLAHDIEARGVKVRPNGLPKDVPPEKTLGQIGRALREAGEAAQGYGVEIWVEVHGAGTQEPQNMRTIMEACAHPAVGICWNSNATDVERGSVRRAFRLLRPYLRSCHINNLWGPYPYRELFRLLRESGYDRYTLCEVGTPVRVEDGGLFYECYRGLWEELVGQRSP